MAFDIMSLLQPQGEDNGRINIIEDANKKKRMAEEQGQEVVTAAFNVDQILMDAMTDQEQIDTSGISQAIDTSMQVNQENMTKLNNLVGEINQQQSTALDLTGKKLDVEGDIAQTELDAQFKLEEELTPLLQNVVDQRNELEVEAQETTEDLLRDYEIAEKDANITWLDFLRPSTVLDALETKLISGPAAKRAIKVNLQKAAAIEAINKDNTVRAQNQIDTVTIQSKLRSQNLRNLYGSQIELSRQVEMANQQREFSADSLGFMKEISGLNTNMMNAATAQLNAMAAAGELKYRKVDNVIKYYQVQQGKFQLEQLKKLSARTEEARNRIQSRFDLIAPSVSLPEGTTLETYETMVQNGLIPPEQQVMITNGVMQGEVSTAAMMNSRDPYSYYNNLLAVSPDLVTPETKIMMSTVQSMPDANGQTLADKMTLVTDPKAQEALRNQHVKEVFASFNSDFGNVVRSNLAPLFNPRDLDYTDPGISVSPDLVEKLKKINANPSSWDGYINTIALALGGDKDVDLEQASMSAANLMAYQFVGINRVTGLGLDKMNSRELNGNAVDASVWYKRLSAIRKGRENQARIQRDATQSRLQFYRP